MELEVGMYVRTKCGIEQIYRIDNNKTKYKYLYKLKKQDGDGYIDCGVLSSEDILKASHNIIDLIEVGDYVNGYKISAIYDDDDSLVNEYNLKHKKCLGKNIYDEDYQEYLIYEEEIETIVTKEQFEAMAYKVGK